MSEKPIERLNYFNGQRLEADDLRLEQEYHLRIQRLLMKSLFSPGVADGFEVSPIEDGKKVVVQPGLALDDLGRAIILVNPTELVPQGRYLCVRYAERKEGVQGGECKVKGPGNEQLARWGGPGRITSEPDLFWRQAPPLADTRELVIAELRVDLNCKVEKVEGGPRRQAVPAPLARVRPVSLEGEKDIDRRNPKVIRFHIAHARPTAVTLYLRASAFSSLHYTEMPSHNHNSDAGSVLYSLNTKAASGLDEHKHGVAGQTSNSALEGTHKHVVVAQVTVNKTGRGPEDHDPRDGRNLGLQLIHTNVGIPEGIFERTLTDGLVSGPPPLQNLNLGGVNMVVSGGFHVHHLSGETDSQIEPSPTNRHAHPLESFTVVHISVGATGLSARDAVPQLSYLKNAGLKIIIDNIECIDDVLRQSREKNPNIWKIEHQFLGGEGLHDMHPLVTHGTGPIRLDLIEGLDFSPDTDHEIKLSVEGDGNGGCIQYNLYVE